MTMFDLSQMPTPAALREACGFHIIASIGERGILFCGNAYSSTFLLDQRMRPPIDRIVDVDGKVEIIVDPLDLGSITLITKRDRVHIPAVDARLFGITLREERSRQALLRQEAKEDARRTAPMREAAYRGWQDLSRQIMRSSDIGLAGYSEGEVQRGAKEMYFGKGCHEEPFVGRDEFASPFDHTFPTAEEAEASPNDDHIECDAPEDDLTAKAEGPMEPMVAEIDTVVRSDDLADDFDHEVPDDPPTSRSRFRAAPRRRPTRSRWEEDE